MELQLGQLARIDGDIGYVTGINELGAQPGCFSLFTSAGHLENLSLDLKPITLEPLEVIDALRIVHAMPLARTQDLYGLQQRAAALKTICPEP